MKNTDDKIVDKIYECITQHKIKCKNDLKLFGITDTALQKEILWEVFEEKIYVWRKGQKRKRERVLYGGTDFNAPTKWVNKNKFDGHLVITDMMAPKPVRSNCQRMWVTDRYGARSNYFQPTGERVLVLD